MGSNILEIIVRAVDQASGTLAGIGQKGTAMSKELESACLKVGAAMTGMGISFKLAADNINNSFLAFDKAMTEVEALGTLSNQEMDLMKQKALELSSTMPLAATDVANAMYQMVSVGYDYSESMAAIDPASKLAVAGSVDLSLAMESVLNTLALYGDQNVDAARATEVLAKAVGVGKWELNDFLIEIMKNIGIASSLGVEFETLAAMNVQLQNSFTDASEAGTSLKTMFTQLVKPEVIAKLKGVGVEVKDANGDFRNMEDILVDLNKAMSTYGGTAEVNGFLTSIFGTYGYRAADALMRQAGGLGELSTEMGDANFLYDQFNTKVEGTAAQLEIANNRMNNAKIMMGEAMAPATLVAAKAMAMLAEGVAALPGPLQTVVGGVLIFGQSLIVLGPLLMALPTLMGAIGPASALLGGVMAGLSGALTGTTVAAGATGGAFATLGVSIGTILPPLALVVAGVAAFYVAYKTNFLGVRDITDSVVGFITERWTHIKDTVNDVAVSSGPAVDRMATAWGGLKEELDDTDKSFGLAEKSAFSLGKVLDQMVTIAGDWATKGINRLAYEFEVLCDAIAKADQVLDKLSNNPVSKWIDAAKDAFGVYFSTLLDGFNKTEQAYGDHVAKFLTLSEKQQIALEIAIEEYERTGDATKLMAIAAEQASAQEQAALDRAIQKFRETGDASELMARMHGNAMNTMAGATDTAVGTMIGKLQAFVRTATGVWQGLQEIVTQGSSYLWYNETSGLWEQMVPAADGQGYVPIGSPLANQQTNTTSGGGSSDPSISPSGLPWKVNDDGTYSTNYDNAGNYVGPGSIYAQQAASSGSGSGTSGTGTGTGGYYAPSGHSPTGSVVTYLVASGDGTYQAIDTAGSIDQINNLTPEQFWEYVAQGFPVYSSGNMAGSSWFPGVEATEEYQDALASMNDAQQEATNAIEDSTDAAQDLANAANSLMNAQQSAANATQTAANATQTATNAAGGFTTATSIATAAQSYMASVLGGTTLAAQQSTSAVGEMNTNVATGVAATANNVAGAYGTMGYTAGLSALQISGITSDLFGSIQSQAQAALAALTGGSTAGGCTGAGCGSVTPGSGLPDLGDSWTIGSNIDWSGYGLGDWGSGGGLPPLPDSPFPWLAEGGDIEEEGGVVVGDAGPEILHLPKGARVSPLPKNRQDAEARKAEHAAAREAKRAALEAERQARLAEQEARRKENEWIDKIANKILNRIGSGRGGGGGDVHLHGIFIADRAGLMKLNKEIEKVKVLEDTRRGRRSASV